MKILELTNFSAGGCGVWARVKNEAELLAKKGHEVKIFSSNIVKGTNEIAPKNFKLGDIEIIRFPTFKLGGESFMRWNFASEALKFKPDIIIAHSYRHPHTTKALALKKKLDCKVFLVTHTPFDRSKSRFIGSRASVLFYDRTLGPQSLRKFDKVISITKWENSFLNKLGVAKNKVVYIPNGIKKEFFITPNKSNPKESIIYTGRVTPIKDLETLIEALKKIKDKKIVLEVLGPAEKGYLDKLKLLTKKLDLEKRVIFETHQYDTQEQISKLDNSKIFVLPSKSEGMPQALVEAMARGKTAIASDNPGSSGIIEDKKTGYLFKSGDSSDLAAKIDFSLSHDQTKVEANAKKYVEQFAWDKIINKIKDLFG